MRKPEHNAAVIDYLMGRGAEFNNKPNEAPLTFG
jgi:hypothetical protein